MVAKPHELVGRTDKQTLKRKTLVAPVVTGGMTVDGVQVAGTPAGVLQMYAAAVAPTGWLLCDGSAVSRTTYAALFAVVGTSYGVGDGSTTFNLPNLTSAFPYGAAPGSTGGAATHTHTFDDGGHTHTSAAHSHALSDAGQAQIIMSGSAVAMRAAAGASWTQSIRDTGLSASTTNSGSSGAALQGSTDSATPGATGSTNAAGTTDSGSSLPPYVGVTFIVKY